MSHLSQVWKRLRTYVSGSRKQENLTQTSLDPKVVLTLRNNVENQGKNLIISNINSQNFVFDETLQTQLANWAKFSVDSPGETTQVYGEIYDLLGDAALKQDVVERVVAGLVASNDQIMILALFQCLESFYSCWNRGEFIDAAPEQNFPQQKMLQIRRLTTSSNPVGIRQVDIYTGLNVMILLLTLHRYVQQKPEMRVLGAERSLINFYPSGKPNQDNFFTSQLLRAINYSDATEIGNFSNIVGEFLCGGNFSNAYLGDANLTGVNLSYANLSAAYLGDTNLTGANFTRANLSTAYLGDANLSGANLRSANLHHTDLSSSNLSGVNLCKADLTHADLTHADLNSSNLQEANLSNCNLTSANLCDANLTYVNLQHGICFGANFSGANLSHANLSSADFCRADISGVDLSHAILQGTNLSDTILFSTNLTHANLHAADLSYAKLHGAKLYGANLRDAMLLGAELSGVDLSHVILDQADLSGVSLSEADLEGASLREAILFGTDLSFARLNKANLTGSNLTGAIFNGTDLSYSDLSDAIIAAVDFSNANLEGVIWNDAQQWEDVRGLETAVNVPVALKEKLGLA
ncbi:pentapeptide repeat-containing protein [Calothrix sp. PCC 6303]|uniref:pentapeptide repeat-containing protein n=1 Tax=Calothrix sp. PCC 6303 TaxID=1170562 RepID=UPI0002A00CFE|nr:pentapeptide repeat-containing protein [Calothrix sp. PCC 6303]AFZ03060.1 pentapeptide repeat protein [Calothrix sp. PCC 6303]